MGQAVYNFFGKADTLIALGGTSYLWNTGGSTASIIVQPDSTTIYTVTVSNVYGCSATDNVTVTTTNISPAADAGPDHSICEGMSDTLVVTGNGTYEWSYNSETNDTIIVSPGSTTQYFVTVTAASTCYDIDTVTVTVYPIPVADAGEDISICQGKSDTLTASGGNNYLWNTSDTTASVVVSPNNTTTYYVTVSSNGCSASDSVAVVVYDLPAAEAGENTAICIGDTTSLTATDSTASGGTIYWSNGDTTAMITVHPLATTVYTVTITNPYGCTATDNVTVTVNPLPHADAGFNMSIVNGDTTTLTATGGTDYLWSTTDTTASIDVWPGTATIYYVTVTDANGCSNTDDVTVLVGTNQLPYPEAYWHKNDSVISTIAGIGKVGIGTDNPTEMLSVGGNMLVDGKIIANRISSPDSLFYIGDSCIVFEPGLNGNYGNRMWSENSPNNYRGFGIGRTATGIGAHALAIGYQCLASAENSICIGRWVRATQPNSMTIGSGISNGNSLNNTFANSLMIGFNSDTPTLFVEKANGTPSSTGNVGIGTTNLKAKLHVKGNAYLGNDGMGNVSLGECNNKSIGFGTSYIGFNAFRTPAGSWETYGDSYNNGGALIYGSVTGDIIFSTIPNTTSGASLIGISDEQILCNSKMVIYKNGNVGIGTVTPNQNGNTCDYYAVCPTCPHSVKLAVEGAIAAREVIVTNSNFGWYDCVFEKDYPLPDLSDVEAYINSNKHLPD